MKRMLILAALFASSAHAHIWHNNFQVNFDIFVKTANFSGDLPPIQVPAINGFPGSPGDFNFEKCDYRIKFPSTSQLEESFTGAQNSWTSPVMDGTGDTYYTLKSFQKFGPNSELHFKSKMGGEFAVIYQGPGKVFVKPQIPLKDNINSVTNPGVYHVHSKAMIIQSTCPPKPKVNLSGRGVK